MGTSLATSVTQIADPLPEAGTLQLQNCSHNLTKTLEMALVFRAYPLTQLVLQLTIQKRCLK
ncbi:hypothetical protein C7B61_09695 [filamentous cyanobacterium CCP1]|nr:hypothetical protein C7B76_02015 [filamentous cyanobacterium CCP2]PSB66762.1 hypothetical protein C7B61_09695 [filamentous cyanobacterium CCP1]